MVCGIDFGTSNSTVGICENGQPRLLPVENGEMTIPTALFFAEDGRTLYGRTGIDEYIEGGEGRFMRALKSILGSSLVEERTRIGRRTVPFTDIITMFLRHLRQQAGEAEAVVLGRPVYFVDGDEKADRLAQDQLANAARQAGFKHVDFEFEPIAAAFDYEQRVNDEELVLVADIGGGTSDFSLVKVSPEGRTRIHRKDDILASGGVHVGGTDFDRVLSLAAVMPHLGYRSKTKAKAQDMPVSYFADLATWHKIPFLYAGRTLTDMRELKDMAAQPHLLARYIHVLQHHLGHQLLFRVEAAKIDLSQAAETTINLDLCENGLSATATQAMLEEASASLSDKIRAAVEEILTRSGVQAQAVNTIAFTGGASRMPIVRREIARHLAHARQFNADALTSVGAGLALAAGRRFGDINQH